MDHYQKKGKKEKTTANDRKSKRARQKNMNGDRKGEPTNSSNIPDRREGKSDILGLPSGVQLWTATTTSTNCYNYLLIVFYIALFSALEQTHCTQIACDSE